MLKVEEFAALEQKNKVTATKKLKIEEIAAVKLKAKEITA